MGYNFNDVCSNLIPTGKYKVQVSSVKFKTGRTGEVSKDMAIIFTIVEGALAKRTIADSIPERAFGFRLKPFLTACKVDLSKEFATAEELYNFGMKEAVGKIINIDVVVKPYNGKQYNNVDNYYPLADSTTTCEEVLEELEVEPVVKAEAAAEGLNVDADADEPTLDIADDELPF